MFREHISKTVEVYIEDMVVMSKKLEKHIPNLAEIFEILRHHKLHPNVASIIGLGFHNGLFLVCTDLLLT